MKTNKHFLLLLLSSFIFHLTHSFFFISAFFGVASEKRAAKENDHKILRKCFFFSAHFCRFYKNSSPLEAFIECIALMYSDNAHNDYW